MNLEMRNQIAERLAPDSPFFQRDPGRSLWAPGPLLLGDRYRLVGNNLRLGWDLGERYALSGHEMPRWLREYPPYRVFRYLTSPASRDVGMAKVHEMLKIPGKRRFLEAGLTTGESTEQLAGRCKTSQKIVSLFAEHCWDIGPRLEDLGFMNELLRLDVIQPIGNPAANGAVTPLTSDEITLLRIAWKKKMPGVLKYLGTPRQEAAPSAEEGRMELGRELHEQAIRGVYKGCCSSEDNVALETFLENFAAKEANQEQRHQPDDDMRRGVGGMSLSAGVLESVKRVLEPDLKKQLALQTGAVSNDPGTSLEQNNSATGPDGFPIKLPAAEKKPAGDAPQA